MSAKEIKKQIMKLEKEYNNQYNKELEEKYLKSQSDEEARIQRVKSKPITINKNGKPVTGRKKMCDYDCDHCHIICSSSESDLDFPEELAEYRRTQR